MAKQNIVFELLVVFALVDVVLSILPDYIKLCKKDDPHIDICVINSIEHLRPYLKVGIPELDVPPIEPLRINGTIPMNLGNGETRIMAKLTDLALYGASTFKILKLWPNIDENYYRYNVSIPRLIVNGTYEIDTQLLFLYVSGNGNITMNLENYNFECTMSGGRIKIGADEHLKFNEVVCEIQFEKGSVHMDNLFNGNKLLGDAVNDVVNDNIDIFFNELKPKFIDAINEIFTDVANKITLRFTYAELFES